MTALDVPPIDAMKLRLQEPTLPDPFELFCDLPVGEGGDRFDLGQAPWVKAAWEWWRDPAVEWIYLIQGSQTSKTTTMMGLLLYAARFDPDPAMWISALEEEADKFVVQRLKPFIEMADSAARSDRKVDWRKTDIRLYGDMLVHISWATSGRKLRSWPCRYIFGDEVGVWPESLRDIGDPLDYVKKRTRRYRDRKGIFATAPSSEHHPAWSPLNGPALLDGTCLASSAASFSIWPSKTSSSARPSPATIGITRSSRPRPITNALTAPPESVTNASTK
jgi:phage terminase large subunit GpA-like protein